MTSPASAPDGQGHDVLKPGAREVRGGLPLVQPAVEIDCAHPQVGTLADPPLRAGPDLSKAGSSVQVNPSRAGNHTASPATCIRTGQPASVASARWPRQCG